MIIEQDREDGDDDDDGTGMLFRLVRFFVVIHQQLVLLQVGIEAKACAMFCTVRPLCAFEFCCFLLLSFCAAQFSYSSPIPRKRQQDTTRPMNE